MKWFFSIKKEYVLRHEGFSLLEIVVVLGISTITMLGVLNVVQIQSKNQQSTNYQMDFYALQTQLNQIFSTQPGCNANFAYTGQPIDYSGSLITIKNGIYRPSKGATRTLVMSISSVPNSQGAVAQFGSLLVTQAVISNSTGKSGSNYTANLVFFTKPNSAILGNTYGINNNSQNYQKMIQVPLTITTAAGKIQSCTLNQTAPIPTPTISYRQCTNGQILNGTGLAAPNPMVTCINPSPPPVTTQFMSGGDPAHGTESFSLQCPPGYYAYGVVAGWEYGRIEYFRLLCDNFANQSHPAINLAGLAAMSASFPNLTNQSPWGALAPYTDSSWDNGYGWINCPKNDWLGGLSPVYWHPSLSLSAFELTCYNYMFGGQLIPGGSICNHSTCSSSAILGYPPSISGYSPSSPPMCPASSYVTKLEGNDDASDKRPFIYSIYMTCTGKPY